MAKDPGTKEQFVFKLVLVGDVGVGKSNLLARYIRNEFHLEITNTDGIEFASKNIELNGAAVKIVVWDTAGEEAHKSIIKKYYQGAVGALLVYDISDVDSFASSRMWLDEIRRYADDRSVIMLVGNKSDLRADREVTTEQGQNFATENGLFFIETSALEANQVELAFENLAEEIYKLVTIGKDPVQTEKKKRSTGKLSKDPLFAGSKSDQNKKCCIS